MSQEFGSTRFSERLLYIMAVAVAGAAIGLLLAYILHLTPIALERQILAFTILFSAFVVLTWYFGYRSFLTSRPKEKLIVWDYCYAVRPKRSGRARQEITLSLRDAYLHRHRIHRAFVGNEIAAMEQHLRRAFQDSGYEFHQIGPVPMTDRLLLTFRKKFASHSDDVASHFIINLMLTEPTKEQDASRTCLTLVHDSLFYTVLQEAMIGKFETTTSPWENRIVRWKSLSELRQVVQKTTKHVTAHQSLPTAVED